MRKKAIPVKGRVVRHPTTMRRLSETGETVVVTGYWTRLEQAGDITFEDLEDETSAAHDADAEE